MYVSPGNRSILSENGFLLGAHHKKGCFGFEAAFDREAGFRSVRCCAFVDEQNPLCGRVVRFGGCTAVRAYLSVFSLRGR